MKLDQTFSVETLPQSEDYSVIPAGWYHASITDASVEPTKAGTGQYIKVRFDITGPSHQGRVVFTNLNIRNPNPKAEEIGQQQLNSLLRSIGVPSISDTDQLIGGNCQIKVTVKNSEQYGEGNEIKGFKAIQGSAPPPPMQQAAPAQQAPAAAKKPWER
jgi:hypothetical protein